MSNTTLHITNGNSLTDNLKEFDYSGEILTWQEADVSYRDDVYN